MQPESDPLKDLRELHAHQRREIANAVRAALEFSPLDKKSEPDTLHGAISTQMRARFWKEIYVKRTEVHEALLELQAGSLLIITGEVGAGKSTAILAVLDELSKPRSASRTVKPCIIDVNKMAGRMNTREDALTMLTAHIYTFFDRLVPYDHTWEGYLRAQHPDFAPLRHEVRARQPSPSNFHEWGALDKESEYESTITACRRQFFTRADQERLPWLLEFLVRHVHLEPLIIIDNIDHGHVSNNVVKHCATVLVEVRQAVEERIGGVIAVRLENAETVRHILDIVPTPRVISLSQGGRPVQAGDTPALPVVFEFIAKRLDFLRGVATTAEIYKHLKKSGVPEQSLQDFVDDVNKLLRVVLYELFDIHEPNEKLRKANRALIKSIQDWHNDSLREVGHSIAQFASDILADERYFDKRGRPLGDLVRRDNPNSPLSQDWRLRRHTQSLILRHLFFWKAPHGDGALIPPHLPNVTVFDLTTTTATPPVPFLRLRILQYLRHKQRTRTTVDMLTKDFAKLEIDPESLHTVISELGVIDPLGGARLLRIDGARERDATSTMPGDTDIHLLPAGKFLVSGFCLTTEYLFWSALVTRQATTLATVRRRLKEEQIEQDGFRVLVAAMFLEDYILGNLFLEHPYLRGLTGEWPDWKAKERLELYRRLFGFTHGDWLLHRAIRSLRGFIPSKSQSTYLNEAREAVNRVEGYVTKLDSIVNRRD